MANKHVTLHHKDGSNDDVFYPTNTAGDVIVTPTSGNNVPSSVNNLEDLVNSLGELAFEDSVAIKVATGDEYGVVQVTDDGTSTDTDTVPTSYAMSQMAANKVSITGNQNIAGVKTFTDGIVIGNIPMSYDSATDTFTLGSAN